MPKNPLNIRPFQKEDETALVALWRICELIVSWNNPHKDIARKLKIHPELFLVGMLDSFLTATVMGGYVVEKVSSVRINRFQAFQWSSLCI